MDSVASLPLLVALAAVAAPARPALAQGLGVPQRAVVAQDALWSPLHPIGDLPFTFPGDRTPAIEILSAPTPRVGHLWTAGNPAGLPWDVTGGYAALRGAAGEASGEYRRPLDPGRTVRVGGSALAWSPLGSGAVIGRIGVERVRMMGPRFADLVGPYGSMPLTWVDTMGSDVGSTGTRLAGVGGWRLGPIAYGLGIGFEGSEVRTLAARVPSLLRVSTPAVTAGLVVPLGSTGLRLGALARARAVTQTLLVIPRDIGTRLIPLDGYRDPTPINLETLAFQRRFERRSRAIGGSLGGTFGPVQWIVGGQRETTAEDQFQFAAFEPPRDTWRADGWSGFVAAQAQLSLRLLASVHARYETLASDTKLGNRDTLHFHSEEYAFRLHANLRYSGSPWMGTISIGTYREHRQRTDELARVGSVGDLWEPWVAAELARELPLGLALAVGGALTQYAPWGVIPDPAKLGSMYREYVAGSMALLATQAATVSGAVTLRWAASSQTHVWLSVDAKSVSPAVRPIGRLEHLPPGSRGLRGAELGVTLR